MPIEKKPFAEGEKRTLQILNPQFAIHNVEAEHKRTEKHPTHESRYYIIGIQGLGTGDLGLGENKNNQDPKPKSQVPVFIQLNGSAPADDEARLAAIAEDLLTIEDAEISEPLRPMTYDL